MGNKIYIGIDPDLKKSGVAFWYKEEKKLQLNIYTVYDIIISLTKIMTLDKKETDNIHVILEAGWLNKKSNFRMTQNKAIGEAIARKVGENHAVGKIIEQTLQELKISYELVHPRTSKVTPAFFEKLTGIKTKNQELIDAGMLVFNR